MSSSYTKEERTKKNQFHPFIVQRAKDWEDIVDNNVLLTDSSLEMVDPNVTKKGTIFAVAASLPPQLMGSVAALWFDEAINGCHIRLPHTEFQLFCYKFFDSYLWTSFMLLVSIVELFGIFLEVPGCDYHGSIPMVTGTNYFASKYVITGVNLVCVFMQLIDVFLWYNSSPAHLVLHDKSRLVADHTYRWMLLRGICCGICILDFLVFYGVSGASPRFSRVLFPVILISRQENTRLIIEGFLIVSKRTLFVLAVLFGIINLWALGGLFLFRNMNRQLDLESFGSLRKSFLTCLHAFASRPAVLFVASAYVGTSNAAPYFFVSLTMITDLLIGTLLIAIANRYFRDFKTLSFRKRLLYRRNALLAIIDLLREKSAKEALERSRRSASTVGLIEDPESKGGSNAVGLHPMNGTSYLHSYTGDDNALTLAEFLNFCTYLDIDPRYKCSPDTSFKVFVCCCKKLDHYSSSVLHDVISSHDDSLLQTRCTVKEFFRMCSFIASKVTIRTDALVHSRESVMVAMQERNDIVVDKVSIDLGPQSIELSTVSRLTTASNMESNPMQSKHRISSLKRQSRNDGELDINSNSNGRIRFSEQVESTEGSMDESSQSLSQHTGSSIIKTSGNHKKVKKTVSIAEIVETGNNPMTDKAENRQNMAIRAAFSTVSEGGGGRSGDHGVSENNPWIVNFSIAVCYPRCHIMGQSFKYISLFNTAVHLLLVVQLCFVATNPPSQAWLDLGFPLLFLFFFDNCVKHYSGVHSKSTTFKDLAINIGALITKCVLGVDASHINQAAYTAMVLVQSCRSLKLLGLIPGAPTLMAIVPVILRVLMLLFLVIYCFTIFAHEFFCGALSTSAVEGADDDAGGWATFALILNFSSYLQSFYTLLMISLLANWSMVMDAAVKSTPAARIAILFFFYLYRLTMTLTVLPLLTSFIIQAFVGQLNLKKIDKEMKRVYKVVSNKMYTTGMMKLWTTNNRETVSGTPNAFRELVAKLHDEVCARAQTVKVDLDAKIDAFVTLVNGLSESTLRTAVENRGNTSAAPKVDKPKCIPCFHIENVDVLCEQRRWVALAKSIIEKEAKEREMMASAAAAAAASAGPSSVLDGVGHEDHGADESHAASIVSLNIPEAYHPSLANIWFSDAIAGRRMELPTTKNQLIAYRLVRSEVMRYIICSVALVQILLTLILPPLCNNQYFSNPAARVSLSNKQQLSIAVFNLAASVLYLFETVMEFWIKISTKRVQQLLLTWTSFRSLCALVLFLSQLSFIGGDSGGRYAMALFPFFVITREINLRQMLHGLSMSIIGSRIVYNLLFFILLVWTFLGYFLFHRFDTSAMRFATLRRSFQTCIHCFTSGPFGLLALRPYFSICQASAVFFVLLTLTTEVMGNALIIAVGNVEYKKFVDKNIERRMECRKNCVHAMWKVFSYNGSLSRQAWRRLCSGIKGYHSLAPQQADFLFSFVCGVEDDATCGLEQFFGLIGLVSICARVEMVENDATEVSEAEASAELQLASKAGSHDDEDDDATKKHRARTLSSGNDPNQQRNRNDTFMSDDNTHHTTDSAAQHQDDANNKRSSRKIRAKSVRIAGFSIVDSDKFDNSLSFEENIRTMASKSKNSKLQLAQRYRVFVPRRVSRIFHVLQSYGGRSEAIATEIHAGCKRLVQCHMRCVCSIGVFELINAVMHILMLIQLDFISSSTTITLGWIRFGWFLEFFFWCEMIIRMVSMSDSIFLNTAQNRNHIYINVASLICMIACGTSLSQGTVAHTLLIIVQLTRLFRVVSSFIGIKTDKFIDIKATVAKVFLIQWSIIYFFATISQLQFCGTMNPNDIDTSSLDDDAAKWPRFANLWNFSTMYYALFTLFEISVLGNWSIVPDALVKEHPTLQTPIYLFFYTYRLLMTLVIYPLLMSFVIRSFISLRDSLSIEQELKLEQRHQQQLFNVRAGNIQQTGRSRANTHHAKLVRSFDLQAIQEETQENSDFNENPQQDADTTAAAENAKEGDHSNDAQILEEEANRESDVVPRDSGGGSEVAVARSLSKVFEMSLPRNDDDDLEETLSYDTFTSSAFSSSGSSTTTSSMGWCSWCCFVCKRWWYRCYYALRSVHIFVPHETLQADDDNNSFVDLWSFDERKVIEKNETYGMMELVAANWAEQKRCLAVILKNYHKANNHPSPQHQEGGR